MFTLCLMYQMISIVFGSIKNFVLILLFNLQHLSHQFIVRTFQFEPFIILTLLVHSVGVRYLYVPLVNSDIAGTYCILSQAQIRNNYNY